MSGRIPISKEGGLEPHLCFCPRCGGDNGELTIGVLFKQETRKGRIYFNRGEGRKAMKSAGIDPYSDTIGHPIHVEDREKVPGGLCDACASELETFKKIVEEGGVYFQCGECGATGVFKADCELSRGVREHEGIEPPKPVGVQLRCCEEHTPQEDWPKLEEMREARKK